MSIHSSFALIIVSAIGSPGAADVMDDPVTKPDATVVYSLPNQLAYLQEKDWLVAVNDGSAYAVDLAANREVWRNNRWASFSEQSIMYFGRSVIVGWTKKEACVLELETGREKWSVLSGQNGPIESVNLSPDETEVLVDFKNESFLYSMDGRLKRALRKKERAQFYAWMPENEHYLFWRYEKTAEGRGNEYWCVVDAGGNAISEWKREFSENSMSFRASSKGEFSQAVQKEDGSTTLRILDIQSGRVVREFDGIQGNPHIFFWMRDARRLFYLSDDQEQAYMADSETGTILVSLSKESHRFRCRIPYEDAAGNVWAFSRDDSDGLYLWPVIPAGTPRKAMGHVLDHFQLYPMNRPYILSQCLKGVIDHWETLFTLYTVEGTDSITSWKYSNGLLSWSDTMLNRDVSHLMFRHFVAAEKGQGVTSTFQVLAPGKFEPLFNGPGNPLAVSPDGRYVVSQTKPALSCLYDLETGDVVQRIPIPVPKENPEYGATMEASFSENGKRLAVNTTRSLVLVELTKGYPQWSMASGDTHWYYARKPLLSPDGARLLCSGYATAWLFDADTGELLHTFDETEQFEDTNVQTHGFWDGLARSAKDWAGVLTDRYKTGCPLEAAFMDDGAKVITHAAGLVIRVWDTASGTLLNTIHTGLPEKRDETGQIKNKIAFSPNGRFAFCYNEDNFGTASLWDLEEGTLARQYQLSENEKIWPPAIPMDDGSAVYLQQNRNLYRWPGAKN